MELQKNWLLVTSIFFVGYIYGVGVILLITFACSFIKELKFFVCSKKTWAAIHW